MSNRNDTTFIVHFELTGVLSSAAELDYEKKQSHSMTIKVSDSGTPQLSSTTSVTVDVLDCNDNRPLFEKKDYTFEVNITSQLK